MKQGFDVITKYEPDMLSVVGLAMMVCNVKLAVHKNIKLRDIYESSDAAFKRYKRRAFMKTHSNNWLKMHGYQKKRKCHLK